MCNLSDLIEEKGIEKGMQKGLEKGLEKGIEKGMQKGIEKGMQKGIEKGMTEAIVMSLQNLMETMGLSLEKACQALKVPVEEYEKILNHKL